MLDLIYITAIRTYFTRLASVRFQITPNWEEAQVNIRLQIHAVILFYYCSLIR